MKIAYGFAALFAGAAAAFAAGSDFEGVPGTFPAPWYYLEGRNTPDICMISNLDAFSGKSSLLIDRSLPKMAAVRRTLCYPLALEPGRRVRFVFLLKPEAAGSDGFRFDGAVWTGRGGFVQLGIKRGGLSVSSGGATRGRLPEYSLELGTWHRITLELPGRGERTGLLRLERATGPHTFGPPRQLEFPLEPTRDAYKTFRLYCPEKICLRVWIDDFTAGPATVPLEIGR